VCEKLLDLLAVKLFNKLEWDDHGSKIYYTLKLIELVVGHIFSYHGKNLQFASIKHFHLSVAVNLLVQKVETFSVEGCQVCTTAF